MGLKDIFTDGSKLDDGVCSAFVYFEDGIEIDIRTFRLSDHISVFIAIRMTLEAAVNYIIDNDINNANIVSDYISALMTLQSLEDKRKILLFIKKKMYEYNGNIKLKQIRAHRVELGYERADKLAKKATQKDIIDLKFHKPKSKIKNESVEK
ncbi:hypothetical protein AVEN_88313-1 [Araneus ventricosus]|uniref:Uncharacterized protein n=1 Tax=Araneus ventricosus TaxID=182803 RepID=A0A4Y2S146_ARAVE|nr:hypothetical protein AVEN_88313-1 [Araneus ventricosus]